MSFGNKYNTETARLLRKNQTIAEKLLWEQLRNRKLDGIKFKRQHPIGSYITDFYCPAYKLVIELDGPIHELKDNIECDKARSEALTEYSFRIMRFQNDEVIHYMNRVLKRIKKEIKENQTLSPLLNLGEGD